MHDSLVIPDGEMKDRSMEVDEEYFRLVGRIRNVYCISNNFSEVAVTEVSAFTS